jgi:hypothetical protein
MDQGTPDLEPVLANHPGRVIGVIEMPKNEEGALDIEAIFQRRQLFVDAIAAAKEADLFGAGRLVRGWDSIQTAIASGLGVEHVVEYAHIPVEARQARRAAVRLAVPE